MTGSIVLATNQGLGILAKDFYTEGIIDKVMIYQHSSRENHYEWYGDDVYSDIEKFLDAIDTLFLFETPFNSVIIDKAKNKGKKIILMPMYECTNPEYARKAEIINPSLLDQEKYPEGTFIPVPVPRSIKWRLREKAKVFIHNAGYGGLNGRNGTEELINAMKYVKSPIKLIIRTQDKESYDGFKIGHNADKYDPKKYK